MPFNTKQLKDAFNPDGHILDLLRTHLIALEEDMGTRYDGMNRKEKVDILFQDLGMKEDLPEQLEQFVSMLPGTPAGLLMRLYNQVTTPPGKTPDAPSVETITLADTDEDVTLEGMGSSALELRLSAEALREEYHGEFTFDGDGPAEFQTFETAEPDSEGGIPSGYTPVGTYRLTNTEQVTLNVAANTGFGGTIQANAAEMLRIDADGLLSPYATVHAANLTQAMFTLGGLDEQHYGHYLNIDAPDLEQVSINANSTLVFTSIADTDSLARVDADIDGELLLKGFALQSLEEANLSGAGRAVFYSDELASAAKAVNINAGELRGDHVPPGENTLGLRIQAFEGAERGTADIIGSHVGQNTVNITGRDMSYTGNGSGSVGFFRVGEWDNLASFSVSAGLQGDETADIQALDLLMRDVLGRGEILREKVALSVKGESYVETEDYYVLTGDALIAEGEGGMANVGTDDVVTLNRFIPFNADTATYNSAFFSKDTGESQWSIDDSGLFDGIFDLDVAITNDDTETLEAFLFENPEGDLYYVLDTHSQAGIEDGANSFYLAEVGEGMVNGEDVQTAADVDSFIAGNSLELLGVGETTLTDPYAIA